MCSAVSIVLTRAAEDGHEFADALRAHLDCDVLVWPLRKRVPLDYPPVDLEDYSRLIITSAAAVRHFDADLAGRRALVVGTQTALAAQSRGVFVDQVFVNVAELTADLVDKNERLLVIRGEPARMNWVDFAKDGGHNIDERVVYTMRRLSAPTQLPLELVSKYLIFPVFSEKSWDDLRPLLTEIPDHVTCILVAFSTAIADAIAAYPAQTSVNLVVVINSAEPSRMAMIEQLGHVVAGLPTRLPPNALVLK